jgi:hypothetical protein
MKPKRKFKPLKSKGEVISVMKCIDFGNGYWGYKELDNLERLVWEAGKKKAKPKGTEA